jgi:hypothetical protein
MRSGERGGCTPVDCLRMYIDVKFFPRFCVGNSLLKLTASSSRKIRRHLRKTKPFIPIIVHLNPANIFTRGFCNVSSNRLCPFAVRLEECTHVIAAQLSHSPHSCHKTKCAVSCKPLRNQKLVRDGETTASGHVITNWPYLPSLPL